MVKFNCHFCWEIKKKKPLQNMFFKSPVFVSVLCAAGEVLGGFHIS